MVSYGVSGSFRVTENLSLGAGFAYVVGSLLSQSDIFIPIEQTLPDGPYGENAYSPEARFASVAADVDSSDWAFNAGFLWHISSQLNLGGFYRQGPTFDSTLFAVTGPAFEPRFPEGTRVQVSSGPLEFPDVFGFGFAYKSQGGASTPTFEWDVVQYSVILDSFRRIEPQILEKMDDGNEVHFGFEYVFLGTSPLVALRLGAWLDPDHRFATAEDDIFKQATFRPGEDEWHLAMGFGLAFERFQIDLGLDLSELVDTASVSLIFSFW
jgi:hypothetical protein